MLKSNNTIDKYKLNKSTELVVKNEPATDENGKLIGYRQTFTLKHKKLADEPQVFADPDEVSDFINNIDLDDEQLSLV